MRELPLERESGPIRFSRDGERWRVHITNLSELRDLIGEDLVVHFARAFAAADRMTSLHRLLAMVGGLDLKSVRYRRDTLTVVFFIWAVMREVPQIIGALMQAGVEPYLEDKTAWNKLLGLGSAGRVPGYRATSEAGSRSTSMNR